MSQVRVRAGQPAGGQRPNPRPRRSARPPGSGGFLASKAKGVRGPGDKRDTRDTRDVRGPSDKADAAAASHSVR
ncbi:MAG: hypothetical protein M3P44_00645 [Actinomycetota bacterium]|nr:hypothetical protein [Actinomycetota bacterium]